MSVELTQSIYGLLSLLGISAIVSGSISALVNYYMTMRSSRRQNIVDLLERKLELYSFIIFYLDRMRFKGEALKKINNDDTKEEHYAYSAKEKFDEIIKPVEEKMENGYYLLRQDIFKEFINIQTLFFHESAKETVPKLRKMLVDEYNSIILNYEKLTGKTLDKLN